MAQWHSLPARLGMIGLAAMVGGCGGGPTKPDDNPPAVTLAAITVAPTSVAGCATATVTATLSGPAPATGAVVALAASPTTAVVLSSIAIPGGATTGTATIAQPQPPNTTNPVLAPTAVTITGSLGASTQTATLNLAAPIAAFTVSGTARGADACQLTNASGQFDCTFNATTSSGATRYEWRWESGTFAGGPTEVTTPIFQPTTTCGTFQAATQGTAGSTFKQMIVRLTVRNASNTASCVVTNANVRVFSAGFCGAF